MPLQVKSDGPSAPKARVLNNIRAARSVSSNIVGTTPSLEDNTRLIYRNRGSRANGWAIGQDWPGDTFRAHERDNGLVKFVRWWSITKDILVLNLWQKENSSLSERKWVDLGAQWLGSHHKITNGQWRERGSWTENCRVFLDQTLQ